MNRCPFALLLLVLSVHVSGCAALPVATLGPMLGVASSAVSTGSEIYQLGKLDTAEMASFEDAVLATRAAASDLGLKVKAKEQRKGDSLHFAFVDDKGAKVKVRLQRRTATLVRARVDVGWFGSETTARLYLSRIRAHLPRFSLQQNSTATGPHKVD
jgi:hypothetical protein